MKAAMAMAMGVAKPVATNPRFQTSRMGSSSHAPCRQPGSVPAASPDAQDIPLGRLLAGAGGAPAILLAALLAGRPDRFRRLHLTHEVIVPVTLDLEMGGGPQLDALCHVVVGVGIDARLKKFVERQGSGADTDEHSLSIAVWRIGRF